MKVLSGGIDIGSEKHHIVVMDAGEAILYDQEVEHNFSEFYRTIDKIFKYTQG